MGINELYQALVARGLEGLGAVFLLAAMPISELRGSIPCGILAFHQSASSVFWVSIAGNLLPVLPLLWLLEPVCNRLSRYKLGRRWVDWLYDRTDRRAEMVRKYEVLGLILLVAIPLPMTGAYTGAVAASLFRIRKGVAFWAITAGVFIAGGIVLALTLLGRWGLS
ncbi:MAG: small multi-drug export protein [Candidatus Omnitrophica bacterium]|nr:small multi-drug export protein [Candidatus Omnitrophota bacterium]